MWVGRRVAIDSGAVGVREAVSAWIDPTVGVRQDQNTSGKNTYVNSSAQTPTKTV